MDVAEWRLTIANNNEVIGFVIAFDNDVVIFLAPADKKFQH